MWIIIRPKFCGNFSFRQASVGQSILVLDREVRKILGAERVTKDVERESQNNSIDNWTIWNCDSKLEMPGTAQNLQVSGEVQDDPYQSQGLEKATKRNLQNLKNFAFLYRRRLLKMNVMK